MRQFYLILAFFLAFPFYSFSQSISTDQVDVVFNEMEGIRFMTKDSANAIHLRFRMQNRVDLQTRSANTTGLVGENGFVRRLRLRSAGYLKSKRLTYSLQLGFAAGDMELGVAQYPLIVRDAVVFYQVSPNFKIGLGQTKLPGNRQRVISSGEQQFVDRSIVNATFNIDRDFGFHGVYNMKAGPADVRLFGALSTGDGRNTTDRGRGMAYTGRAEILPFGKFKMEGDYFEGDWAYEETPKLSIGGTYSYNDNASKVGGQLGRDLYGKSDITSIMADYILKYRGWASYSEFQHREAQNPVTTNVEEQTRFVYTGNGFNTQLSYQFRNHFELAGRYSFITPDKKVDKLADEVLEYTLGAVYYYRWHRIKFMSDLTLQQREIPDVANSGRDSWILRFQVELGI